MGDKSEFFIDDLLHTQEHRFCTYSNANIYVTTFNVNGRSPPEYIGNWLHLDTSNFPDLIAIGLQEMDLALGTYVTDSAARQHEWLFVLQRSLPNFYIRVESIRLIGIFLVVYKRKDSKFRITNVQTAAVATGFLKFGNKGGVGVSMQVNDTSVCFLNSHLAAGNGELARRNQDFRDISQMIFPNFKGIYEHDALIWLGDLNYRLSTPLSFEEIAHVCENNEHRSLFYLDQLREQQNLRTAFNGFRELDPNFKPTYKYDVGTSRWDSSEKRRVPAWCDRILYRTRDKNVKLQQKTYSSQTEVVFSDHKPVTSTFVLAVKQIDTEKRLAIYDEMLKETDKRANNLLPQITLSQTEFELGAIGFDTSAVGIVVLKNTGLTPTRFRFASQHQSLSTPLIADSWLTVTPNNSFIDVDSDVSITLEVRVKNAEAQRVQKSTALSCILVIKLDGGRDYFLVVSATYVPPSVSGELNHQREQQPQQQQQRQQQQPLQQQQLQQQQLQQQSQQQSKLMNNEDWLIKFDE